MVEKIIEQEAKELNGNYKNIFIVSHSQGVCVAFIQLIILRNY